ncbi:MAG: hypothetical protein WCH98_03130 [Verrucomicrobiota bacterium]
MKFSKVEILLIAGAAINALAELANLLPENVSGKVTAALLALWAMLRFVLRFLQASPASLQEIENLRGELHGRVNEIESRRAEPVTPQK